MLETTCRSALLLSATATLIVAGRVAISDAVRAKAVKKKAAKLRKDLFGFAKSCA